MTKLLTAGLPISDAQRERLRALIADMDGPSLLWLGGYLTALGQMRGQAVATVDLDHRTAEPGTVITVLFGSQTGNAQRVATKLHEALRAAGWSARLFGANDYPRRELKTERCLLSVISTQGDGDPPDHARDLLEFLQSKRAPRAEALRYAVLALGDSSYPHYCVIGHQLDARLEALGATRLLPVAEADVDVETVADPWIVSVLAEVDSVFARPDAVNAGNAAIAGTAATDAAPAMARFDRAHPYQAEIITNQRITGRESDRDVRHIELLLRGSEIAYEPGDALGVVPVQADALVEEILTSLRLDGGELIDVRGERMALSRWLRERRELTVLTRPFLAAHAERSGAASLQEALDPAHRDKLAALMQSWQVADLLTAHPASWTAPELVAALRPLAPRLYSIASSPLISDGEEVHLTVAHVDYQYEGVHRWGVASRYLADRAVESTADVFVEANERFRLPVDPARDIIMIGPGTGVAPFRAFVQHRAATGAKGRNWLFFGNRHFRSEFLYQTEWQAALANGRLHRLDLAFSRDGDARVYVQDRMLEQGAALYDWLQAGAYFYVCGDASRMAPDVHAALRRIAVLHGGMSDEAAEEFLSRLANDGRYVRDVY